MNGGCFCRSAKNKHASMQASNKIKNKLFRREYYHNDNIYCQLYKHIDERQR